MFLYRPCLVSPIIAKMFKLLSMARVIIPCRELLGRQKSKCFLAKASLVPISPHQFYRNVVSGKNMQTLSLVYHCYTTMPLPLTRLRQRLSPQSKPNFYSTSTLFPPPGTLPVRSRAPSTTPSSSSCRQWRRSTSRAPSSSSCTRSSSR